MSNDSASPSRDRIVAVVPHADGDEVILHSAFGRALRIAMNKLATVASGSIAGMSLKGDDRVVSASLDHGDDLIVMHHQGFAKRVALTAYPTQERGGDGVASADPARPATYPVGGVAFAFVGVNGATVSLFSRRGHLSEKKTRTFRRGDQVAGSRRMFEFDIVDDIAGVIAQ